MWLHSVPLHAPLQFFESVGLLRLCRTGAASSSFRSLMTSFIPLKWFSGAVDVWTDASRCLWGASCIVQTFPEWTSLFNTLVGFAVVSLKWTAWNTELWRKLVVFHVSSSSSQQLLELHGSLQLLWVIIHCWLWSLSCWQNICCAHTHTCTGIFSCTWSFSLLDCSHIDHDKQTLFSSLQISSTSWLN